MKYIGLLHYVCFFVLWYLLDDTYHHDSEEAGVIIDVDWRVDLEGLPTEEYNKTCARITAIDYGDYLRSTSTNAGFTKQQAHRDWRATIDRLLQSKHIGLLQKGKELQR